MRRWRLLVEQNVELSVVLRDSLDSLFNALLLAHVKFDPDDRCKIDPARAGVMGTYGMI